MLPHNFILIVSTDVYSLNRKTSFIYPKQLKLRRKDIDGKINFCFVISCSIKPLAFVSGCEANEAFLSLGSFYSVYNIWYKH